MAYQLAITEEPSTGPEKGFGTVLLDNLPADYKVYLFYYGGAMPDDALEGALRKLGEDDTAQNLFVNIGTLGDPRFGEIASRFQIKKYPVIVMTAMDTLASPPGQYLTAFVRLDSSQMLRTPERTIACVREIFTLFLQGKVTEAISQAKWQQRTELVLHIGSFLGGALAGALKGLGDFIAARDLSVGVGAFKLELKKSGG